jgi:hypothetical protein
LEKEELRRHTMWRRAEPKTAGAQASGEKLDTKISN